MYNFNLAVEYWVKEKVSFGSNVFVVSLELKRIWKWNLICLFTFRL